MVQDMIHFGEYSMVAWKSMQTAIIGWSVLYMSIRVYSLIIENIEWFYILADFLSSLSNNYGERVSKSPTIIVDLTSSHFSFVSFALCILKLWCLVHTHQVLLCSLVDYVISFFVLSNFLHYEGLLLMFLWYIFFHAFTYYLPTSYLKLVSWRQYTVESRFLLLSISYP